MHFRSYKSIANHYASVRNPALGKPVSSFCRLWKEGDKFVFRLTWGTHWQEPYQPTPIAEVTPDDVLTFVLPYEKMLQSSNSLTMGLHKILPTHLARQKTGVYRIGGMDEFRAAREQARGDRQHYRAQWNWLTTKAPRYFEGIKFNLVTSDCLNPRPDPSVEVVPERRTQWLRDLRRYKRGLLTRVKVGALDQHIEWWNITRGEQRKKPWNERNQVVPIWAAPELVAELVACMKANEYPVSMLKNFVASTGIGWRGDMTNGDVKDAVERVFTKESENLRRLYGVFK